MPIDGHAYLVKQGWGGKGTGLRQGAISRPVTIAQKKTLAGVGKDRDEAFPFWDHVFEAAAMSIQVKIQPDDDDSDSEATPTSTVELQRTKTGIISNRRPKTGAPALSGTTTPDSQASGSGSVTPRLSLMATAKQEAAKRMLYASFFRGPVLGPNEPLETAQLEGEVTSTSQPTRVSEPIPASVKKSKKGKERAIEPLSEDGESAQPKPKKQKKRSASSDADEDPTKKETKRRKREAREQAAGEAGRVEGMGRSNGSGRKMQQLRREKGTMIGNARKRSGKAESREAGCEGGAPPTQAAAEGCRSIGGGRWRWCSGGSQGG
ncbi:uncharacterized protein B0H18DRAFT_926227 [Fomitopsis serialis]|uniref:uncharacterized protein n=1 Tax=Fomitopsis serialis TaxID=139415 RepID=UPI0020077AC8|nr:uncharacterized protein B0H18DRAFT_926227 [Neoantrodia serialis]KAH9936176.1 hypothetical protein B0H18DRAFT_926227 [Neoantrodia serialis]